MKKSSYSLHSLMTLLALSLFMTGFAQSDKAAQEKANEEALKNLVESRRYAFAALSATPARGRSRQIDYGYELRVKNDTLDVTLPYFGQAYSADYGGANGGIDFKTTSFTYTETPAKKGGWDILIVPKDVSNVSKITMRIMTSGYTTVQVNSNTRDMISFYGSVQPLK